MTYQNEYVLADCMQGMDQVKNESVRAIITDPPYFILNQSSITCKNRSDIKLSADFDTQFKDKTEYLAFMDQVIGKMVTKLLPDAFIYMFVANRYASAIWEICERYGLELFNFYYWVKCLDANTPLFVKHNGQYKMITIEYCALHQTEEFYVPSCDANKKIIWCKIKKITDMGIQNAILLRTYTGKEIICNENHRFPTTTYHFPSNAKTNTLFNRFRITSANNIKPDKSYIYNRINITTSLPAGDENEYNDGFIIGFYMAEGSWIYRNYKPYLNNPLSIASQKGILALNRTIKPRGRNRRGVQFSCGKSDIDRGYINKLQKYHININKISNHENSIHITNYDEIYKLISQYVNGETSHDKYLLDSAFNRSIMFLKGIIAGYSAGDGHYDAQNDRWRFGIAPNFRWRDQINVICQILGYIFRIEGNHNISIKKINKNYECIKFSIHTNPIRSRHIVNDFFTDKIKSKDNCGQRHLYDIEIEPYDQNENEYNNMFFLGNGIWTHNSNPAPQFRKVNYLSAVETAIILRKGNPKINFGYTNDMHNTIRMKICGDPERLVKDTPNEKGEYESVHPTQKPVKLIETLLKHATNPYDLVLDPFAGVATTNVACYNLARQCISFEMNPEYHHYGQRRLDHVAGRSKIAVQSTLSFGEKK